MSGFISSPGFIGAPGFIVGNMNPIIPHIGEYTEYNYTGSVVEYTCQYTGWLKCEVWGARGSAAQGIPGGTTNGAYYTYGALGTYSVGAYYVYQGQKLYVCVGGMGNNGYYLHEVTSIPAGYNATGLGRTASDVDKTYYGSSSGGTHIALKTGLSASLTTSDFIVGAMGGQAEIGNVGWPPELYNQTYYANGVGGPGGGGVNTIVNAYSYGAITKSTTAGVRDGHGYAKITIFAM